MSARKQSRTTRRIGNYHCITAPSQSRMRTLRVALVIVVAALSSACRSHQELRQEGRGPSSAVSVHAVSRQQTKGLLTARHFRDSRHALGFSSPHPAVHLLKRFRPPLPQEDKIASLNYKNHTPAPSSDKVISHERRSSANVLRDRQFVSSRRRHPRR